MFNQESALNSLVSSIEKLQEHQKVLAKYTAGMKRQLDDLSEQFNNVHQLSTKRPQSQRSGLGRDS